MRKKIKKNLPNIVPLKIRSISLSLALFMMGRWLGTDTFFSIYVKEVVGGAWGVTVIWTILAVVKLLFVLPVWKMNDRVNVKYILLMWKLLYVCSGTLFFLAWITHSLILLIFASIFNGIANATTFTTYRSYYAKKSTKSDNAKIFWIYFSAFYFTEVIWSLIAAVLVNYLELPYMYLFVVIFALISVIQDQKVKNILSRHYNQTRKRFNKRVESESKQADELTEETESELKFFGKWWFAQMFFKECLSLESRKEIRAMLRKYDGKMYVALGSRLLTNFLNWTSFLFIPIVAAENNLSLSQIALIFAAMKLPYVINIFMWKFGDKYSKKLMISIILVLVSFLYVALWFHEWFYTILILTFFISLWIAILNPLTSALVISYTEPKDKWSIAWVEEFVWRMGDIAGSLWFGILTGIIWLQKWFIVTWICTFWLWMYLMIKKIISYHHKNNEREKNKEVYELPVPVIDTINKE